MDELRNYMNSSVIVDSAMRQITRISSISNTNNITAIMTIILPITID